ncbi:DUF1127 domain-containing protein [Mesorhizobium sp. ASY16-5R]|jgi:uncharacterized protein YjiS (DUF1127 family)|uniref:DUF1127 domain-containing protein n=1 Tax=Mesorhizobium sp. ASY16-5R TaxID=3445772 RepID=UPI003F9F8926
MSTMKTISPSGSFRDVAPGIATRLARLLSMAVEGLSVMAERRRSRLLLLEMTDSQLKDIGLSRADAEREGLRRPWQ